VPLKKHGAYNTCKQGCIIENVEVIVSYVMIFNIPCDQSDKNIPHQFGEGGYTQNVLRFIDQTSGVCSAHHLEQKDAQ
jgi:hypothetical protein